MSAGVQKRIELPDDLTIDRPLEKHQRVDVAENDNRSRPGRNPAYHLLKCSFVPTEFNDNSPALNFCALHSRRVRGVSLVQLCPFPSLRRSQQVGLWIPHEEPQGFSRASVLNES